MKINKSKLKNGQKQDSTFKRFTMNTAQDKDIEYVFIV